MRCIQPPDFSAAQKISGECRLYLHVSPCEGLAVRPARLFFSSFCRPDRASKVQVFGALKPVLKQD